MNKKTFLTASVKKSEKGEDIFSIVASSSAIDRQGDSVDQAGWDLGNFKQNPVLLWAHDYTELPIGKVVSAEVVDGKLVADFIFAPMEANPKAQQVKALYEGGYLNASSVGFIPLERQGHIITRAELLELSLVPVPANQEALRLAMSKGLDVSLLAKDLEKGAIADEITMEETYEKKWELFGEVNDVICAFWSVFFTEETSVNDFKMLLDETIVLLQKVSAGDLEMDKAIGEIAKKMSPESNVKFFAAMKAGKVLSKKNLELIEGAVNSMKQATTALEELATSAKGEEVDVVEDVEEVDGTKSDADAEKSGGAKGDEVITLSASEMMKFIQTTVRMNTKSNEGILSLINQFVAQKKDVSAE